ncbi:MAG: M48 family metallopeptidase [Sedimentisphaerales bacterium]|nr:M48 family metallopeptidase [Sedimentisphaerales bacterium]
MSGLFYYLGQKVGPKVRKAKWMWLSATGSEAETIAVEYEVGLDLAREVRSQLGQSQDAQNNQILSEIGRRLAECVANKHRRFAFEAIQGAEPNAFALPGGFVFITQSLIDLCRHNEDEIAFILGHEMAHIMRGHAMNRIVSNSAVRIASRAAPVRGVFSGWLRRVGVQFLESAYSQDMESDADRLGTRLVLAAGYDPKGGVKLFTRLGQLHSPGDRTPLGKYFSSHPPFGVRINRINRMLNKPQRQARS